MKENRLRNQILLSVCLLTCFLHPGIPAYAQEKSFPVLTAKYIDKDAPDDEAAVFAKGIVSTEGYEHSAPAFSPDGKTVVWGIVEKDRPSVLLEMRKAAGKWARSQPVSFSARTSDDMYPAFSADGKQLFFGSRRPLPGGTAVNDIRLWVVNVTASGWDVPAPLDSTASKGFEYAHSISKNGTLFFSARKVENEKPKWNIYCSRRQNGVYQ